MSRPQRRSQAERSGEMRARLAEAAYAIIAERGHSAFRMAAVAERAGVSVGAMLHHFPSKDEMTLAAIDHALSRAEQATRLRVANTGAGIRAALDAIAADFTHFFNGDRFWVALDITMDASKNVEVASSIGPIVAHTRKPAYDLWTAMLIDRGWDHARAEEAVRSIAALACGHAIRTLWDETGDGAARTLARWIDHLMTDPAA